MSEKSKVAEKVEEVKAVETVKSPEVKMVKIQGKVSEDVWTALAIGRIKAKMTQEDFIGKLLTDLHTEGKI